MFSPLKTLFPHSRNQMLVIALTYPCSSQNYIVKADRNLVKRLHKNGSRSDQPFHQQFFS